MNIIIKTIIKKFFIILSITIVAICSYSLKAYASSLIMDNPQGKLVVKLPYDNQYFINLDDMLPGERFYKEMDVINESKYSYELYFKVSPKQGLNSKSLQLLNYINMKIIYEDNVIYDGCADGKKIKDKDSGSLSEKVSLGIFRPNDTKKLKVLLSVSKNLDSSFNDLESFTVWDFYSTRIYEGMTEENIDTPNINHFDSNNVPYVNTNSVGGNTSSKILNSIIPYTGDSRKLYIYLLCIFICIVITMLLNKKKEKIKYEL